MTRPTAAGESGCAPWFLLRVAGLADRDVDALHSPRSAAWADGVLEARQRTAREASALAADLAEVIGAVPERTQRRALLAVRRAVYNVRRPAAAATEVAQTVLPAEPSKRLDDWLNRLDDDEHRDADGASVVADELASARVRLAGLGQDPRLRKGMQIGAPHLERELDGFLDQLADAAGETLAKRHRSVERSLVNYAFRAAYKTSPFSSFTRLCLGWFTDDDQVLSFDVDAATFRDVDTVNLAELGTIAQAAARSAELRGSLPVMLTPGWCVDGERIRYVRRQYARHDVPTAPTAGVLEETDFSLPRGAIVTESVEIVDACPGITLDDLTDRLHAVDPPARPRDRLAAFTSRLVESGLLLAPNLRVDPAASHPVEDFTDRLAAVRSPLAADVRERLGLLSDRVPRIAAADLPERATLLDESRQHLRDAHRVLGSSEPTGGRTVCYEDAVATTTATADTRWWNSELLPQLQRLCALLPMSDPLVVDRALLTGYFREQYGSGGRCDDLARFALAARQRCAPLAAAYNRDGLAGEPPFAGSDLAAIRDARLMVADALRERADADEVSLDDALLDRVREHTAHLRPEPLSATFHLQVFRRHERRGCVLNDMHSGLGLAAARFGYPLEAVTGQPVTEVLRRRLAEAQPEPAVFAEVSGGYDASNLSWHPPLAPYQIVGPAEIGFRPDDELLPIDDLALVDDPVSGRLQVHSRRLGRRVVPVYLGSLAPVALPDIQRTLVTLSCATMPSPSPGGWLAARPAGDVEVFPRVGYRDVVLTRASWSVPPDAFPDPGGSLADRYLAWRRWWSEHGLPTRMFYSVPAAEAGLRGHLAEKPRYVSVDSVLSLTAFAHSLRFARAPVRMTEMLPEPQDGLLDGYASEICVELTPWEEPR